MKRYINSERIRKSRPAVGRMAKRRAKNPGLELVIMGNPRRRSKGTGKARHNPVPATSVSGDSVQAYRDFHGADPTEVIAVQESARERNELAMIGDLQEISGRMADGSHFCVKSDDIKLAQNPEGTQLYLVGGSQENVMRMLVRTSADTSKDLIEIGEATRVIYQTRKEMHNFERINYDHKFAEDGGIFPILFFDKLKRRMFLVGGTYQVRPEGIIN